MFLLKKKGEYFFSVGVYCIDSIAICARNYSMWIHRAVSRIIGTLDKDEDYKKKNHYIIEMFCHFPTWCKYFIS